MWCWICRGPGGHFWYYDDDLPVQRRMEEPAHIKPREVYMAVYSKREQEWATDVPASGTALGVERIDDGADFGADGERLGNNRNGPADIANPDGAAGGGHSRSFGGVSGHSGFAVDSVPAVADGGTDSPRKRRLRQKAASSQAGPDSPVPREATRRERKRKAADLERGSTSAGCE